MDRLSEEDIDDIVERILERLRSIRGGIWCRRCDKRLGFEDPWSLCVPCQEDIGSTKLEKLIKFAKPNKR